MYLSSFSIAPQTPSWLYLLLFSRAAACAATAVITMPLPSLHIMLANCCCHNSSFHTHLQIVDRLSKLLFAAEEEGEGGPIMNDLQQRVALLISGGSIMAVCD